MLHPTTRALMAVALCSFGCATPVVPGYDVESAAVDEDPAPADAPATTDDDDGGAAPSEGCTWEGFVPQGVQAFQDERDPEHPLFVYQAVNERTTPRDLLQIQSFQAEPYFGPSGPGVTSLEGANYADCALCAFMYVGCTEDVCEHSLFADTGEVEVVAMDGARVPVEVTLHDVVFREVTVDEETWESTPVPGGLTWCMNGQLPATLPEEVF